MPRFWTDIYDDHGKPMAVPETATALRVAYFDIEIRTPLEALDGSWERVRMEGGVSIGCIWQDPEGIPTFFDDHDLSGAVEMLNGADVVVGFHSQGFDLPLLENHFGRSINPKEHFDIFSAVRVALDKVGKPWKGHGLDALCLSTLGKGKTGHGSKAPLLAQEGKWAELTNYCLSDVLLTRELCEFIRQNGYVIDRDGEKLSLMVPEWFRKGGGEPRS